jgi:hypothetical protein
MDSDGMHDTPFQDNKTLSILLRKTLQ